MPAQDGATLRPDAAAVVAELAAAARVYVVSHVCDDVGEATVRGALEAGGLLGGAANQARAGCLGCYGRVGQGCHHTGARQLRRCACALSRRAPRASRPCGNQPHARPASCSLALPSSLIALSLRALASAGSARRRCRRTGYSSAARWRARCRLCASWSPSCTSTAMRRRCGALHLLPPGLGLG